MAATGRHASANRPSQQVSCLRRMHERLRHAAYPQGAEMMKIPRAEQREERRAEVAFAVINGYQGIGLGGRLLKHLIRMAHANELREFVAEVLAENQPMLRVFERSGLAMRTMREAGVLHVVLEIDEPVAGGG